MRKLLLLIAFFAFLSGCNTKSEPRPDAERVIKDTVAQTLMKPFYQLPVPIKPAPPVQLSDKNITRAEGEQILAFIHHLQKSPQHFVVDNSAETEINGTAGTHVAFKPHSFIDAAGKEVVCPVDIELKECYTPLAMLNENLGSIDGHAMESRGAVYVQAYAQGKPLHLKDDADMKVTFPFSINRHNAYGFFSLAGTNNWIKVNEANDISSSTNEALASTGVVKPDFSYHGLNLQAYLLQVLHYPDYAKANELSGHVEATIHINENGVVTGVTTLSDYVVFRERVKHTLANMPAWAPATYQDRPVASTVKINFDFNLRRPEQVTVQLNPNEITYATGYNVLQAVLLKEQSTDDAYTRSFTGMGWINYAKALDAPAHTADVVVKADENTDVRIIYNNGRSIISGKNCIGYTRFQNVAVNNHAVVLAVKYNNGQAYYAIQPVNLQKQNVILPVFKKSDDNNLAKVFSKACSV